MKDSILDYRKNKQLYFFLYLLLTFHLIGIALFLYPNRPENLSGFNILLCAMLVFWSAVDRKKELQGLIGIIIGGFAVEVIGVNTGLLFGTYEYGSELGLKAYGVPLVLGLNWYCVVISAVCVVQYWMDKRPLIVKALLVGLLSVGLDYLIEPVAIRFDFWSWEGGLIPLFNYVCWGVFASIFAFFYMRQNQAFNPVGFALYFVWFGFFLILNLF